MRGPVALAIASLIFLATFSLYSMLRASAHEIPTVVTLFRYYWDGEVVLCPPEELKDDVQWAAEKWNRAIQYFSIRYMLLDAARTRIRVSSEGDNKCNVFFEYFESLEHCPLCPEGKCELTGPSPSPETIVAYVNFTSPPLSAISLEVPTPVKTAKIHLWRGLDGPERRAMLLHEIAVLLGIGPPRYVHKPPYRSASELWGSLDVTSIDVYALSLKNRYAEIEGGIIEAPTPIMLPYTTVEEDLFHTSIALCVSVMAAIAAYLALSGRWKVAG